MSHSCPECGMCCHCSGDIEDHDTGEEFTDVCTCCSKRIPDIDEDEFDKETFIEGTTMKDPTPLGF